MSVLYIALPVAIALGALALVACIRCIRGGQFDDLESPPMRMLIDDEPDHAGAAGDGHADREESDAANRAS